MQNKELTPKYAALASAIEARLGAKLERLPTSTGELGYRVDADLLIEVCRTLRDEPELKFEMLIDVCGVDYQAYGQDEWQTDTATATGFSRGRVRDLRAAAGDMDSDNAGAAREAADEEQINAVGYRPKARFAAVYHLLSVTHNHRLRIRAFCPSDERPILASVYEVWNSADWFEREAFDLYGILFKGHPDLRRILTDYGFIGHPFRKDFPLIGNVEVRYDPVKGRVVYEPVSIEPRTLVPKVIRSDNRYDPDLKDAPSNG
ncbi:MAG TPA: NADH-quinone oxidoreductase subunit C [Gammaproteobacteria bacterium]|nr:NADH-quinone oxidoreductase subunit C [Gammaproteobacteria bacterium]